MFRLFKVDVGHIDAKLLMINGLYQVSATLDLFVMKTSYIGNLIIVYDIVCMPFGTISIIGAHVIMPLVKVTCVTI